MILSRSTLFHVLTASAVCIPFVAAQTELTAEQLNANLKSTATPAPGFNVEGGSVFGNFVNAVNNKQLFMVGNGRNVWEKPGSEPTSGPGFLWCSDLTFSDFSNSSLIGYAGRCVDMGIPDMGLTGYAEMIASGGTIPYSPGDFSSNLGISAVYSEQLNAFEGQYHSNTDDWVLRFWDSGIRTVPLIIWEGHDEGDMSANAATSSSSMFGENMWMTVEEVAQLFNASTDDFTPETFTQVYEDTWIKGHQEEAATNNPNPESEQAIIDEVQNEADSTDGGTVADDGSGTRRQLVSVAGRFVSAALRVFGI